MVPSSLQKLLHLRKLFEIIDRQIRRFHRSQWPNERIKQPIFTKLHTLNISNSF